LFCKHVIISAFENYLHFSIIRSYGSMPQISAVSNLLFSFLIIRLTVKKLVQIASYRLCWFSESL